MRFSLVAAEDGGVILGYPSKARVGSSQFGCRVEPAGAVPEGAAAFMTFVSGTWRSAVTSVSSSSLASADSRRVFRVRNKLRAPTGPMPIVSVLGSVHWKDSCRSASRLVRLPVDTGGVSTPVQPLRRSWRLGG